MPSQPQSTLLDLVRTLSFVVDNDREVVAIVTALVNSGCVHLCGTFAGATIDISPIRDGSSLTPSSFLRRVHHG
jgi:hypothetical protein